MRQSTRRIVPLMESSNQKPSRDRDEEIKVAIRMRPLNMKEESHRRIWEVNPELESVTQVSDSGRPLRKRVKNKNHFSFDKVFTEESKTRDVYDSVAKGIVDSVVDGLNGTIIAYGQTSSGKTYTMQGARSSQKGGVNETEGILQMAAQDIFSQLSQKPERAFLLRVSYVEIYNEEVRDLLDSNNILQVRKHPRHGVLYSPEEVVVTDFSALQQILFYGDENRAVAATGMNQRSSRSHTIFRITLESKKKSSENNEMEEQTKEHNEVRRISTINLVDLAGSESVRRSEDKNYRMKESAKINLSLMALSRVVVALGKSNQHINYRDSKLTRILQPSLSGNVRMAIICCVTASELYYEDTRATFMFGSTAKLVKTNAAQVDDAREKSGLVRKQESQDEAENQLSLPPTFDKLPMINAQVKQKEETINIDSGTLATEVTQLSDGSISEAGDPSPVNVTDEITSESDHTDEESVTSSNWNRNEECEVCSISKAAEDSQSRPVSPSPDTSSSEHVGLHESASYIMDIILQESASYLQKKASNCSEKNDLQPGEEETKDSSAKAVSLLDKTDKAISAEVLLIESVSNLQSEPSACYEDFDLQFGEEQIKNVTTAANNALRANIPLESIEQLRLRCGSIISTKERIIIEDENKLNSQDILESHSECDVKEDKYIDSIQSQGKGGGVEAYRVDHNEDEMEILDDKEWNAKFKLLEKFKKRRGHCAVRRRHKEDGKDLGWWLHKQRRYRNKGTLCVIRASRLEQLGVVWDTNDKEWSRSYFKDSTNAKTITTFLRNLGKDGIPCLCG